MGPALPLLVVSMAYVGNHGLPLLAIVRADTLQMYFHILLNGVARGQAKQKEWIWQVSDSSSLPTS